MKIVPYPLRALKLSLAINLFGFWVKPQFRYFQMTEHFKEQGETIWYARWAWFQISYSRWL